MSIFKVIITVLFLSAFLYSQPVTTDPEFITENDSIIIYFNAAEGDAGLQGFTDNVYAHTGVITNLRIDSHDWKYVMAPWATNFDDIKLIRDSLDHYHLVIGKPRVYYNNNHQNLGPIPPDEHIQKLAFVFRNADGSRSGRDVAGADIFVDLYEPGLNVVVNNPDVSLDFGDPQRSPAFVKQDSPILIKIKSVTLGTETASLTLIINDSQVAQSNVDSLDYLFNYSDYSPGSHDVVAVGTDTSGNSDSTIFMMFGNPSVVNSPPPDGVASGITINNPTSVTFLLFTPYKDFVCLIGDFNDWKVETDYFLNRWEEAPDNVV